MIEICIYIRFPKSLKEIKTQVLPAQPRITRSITNEWGYHAANCIKKNTENHSSIPPIVAILPSHRH